MGDYGRRLVVDANFDSTLREVMRGMQLEGLDIITRFDLREYLQRHLHRECRRYAPLQAASPELMLQVLHTSLEAGCFLPITITIFELADGETAVEVTEPFAPVISDTAWRHESPALAQVADRECAQVARALDRVQHAIAQSAELRMQTTE